jgi:SpoVK/Ycf46/Vps4 family AAA+-type ATPase
MIKKWSFIMIRKYLLLFILGCHFSVFSMEDNNYILPRNFSEPDLVAATREPEYELHRSPSAPNLQSLQNLHQQPETNTQPSNEHELPQDSSAQNLQQPESEMLDSSSESDHSDSEEEARLRAENRRRKGKEPAHNDEAGPSRREPGPSNSDNSEAPKAAETDLDPDSLKLQKFLAHETLRYTSKINTIEKGLCDIVLKYSPSEVQELLDTINDPERFKINDPDEIKLVSALFYGPSGSGKTTLAKVIATKTNSLGIRIDCTKVGSTYQSSAELNIDTAINEATKHGCLCVILLDEIDSLIPLNTINENIDTGGIKSLSQCIEKHYNNPNLILIGTTNYFGRLPNSITDRMPFLIELTLPNKEYRKDIITYFLRKMDNNKVNLDSCLQDKVLKPKL